MIVISHRGNIAGPNADLENSPEAIMEAINMGFHVEVDLWVVEGRMWLGHDNPEYLIDSSFITDKFWVHCKNTAALFTCRTYGYRYFWHEYDDYAMVSTGGILWAKPGVVLNDRCVAVMPEELDWKWDYSSAYAVCTDYPKHVQALHQLSV